MGRDRTLLPITTFNQKEEIMEIELLDEPTTALTVTARAALALSSDQTRKDLQALVAKSANIKDIRNAAARDECHGAAMALVRARTTINKTGKAAREDAAAFQKSVIAEEKDLIEITAAEEARLLGLRDAWDDARAQEKAEAERIERERIMTIHLRIADIREVGTLALQCRTSEAVQNLIDRMTGLTLDGYDEFTDEAHSVRTDALARMGEIHTIKLAEEAERARIKAEQEAESARLAAERAELGRQRKEAAQAERIAAQERAAQEAHAKAMSDEAARLLANERAAFEREQTEARAKAQAEADRLAAERAEFDAEVARRDAEARALATTTVTEIICDQVEVTGPAPLESDPIFHQEDGGDLLDGPAETWPQSETVIAAAVGAVADRFNESWPEAVARIGAIDWSAITPELLEQAA
jgi:hypothetical protein